MRLLSYVQANRTINPTGVGKHVINMNLALSKSPDVHLALVMAGHSSQSRDQSALHDLIIDAKTLPATEKMIEIAWQVFGIPRLDAYTATADWIYSATEVCLPVSKANMAVTCHDVSWLEPELSETSLKDRVVWRHRLSTIKARADLILTVSNFSRDRLRDLLGIEEERIEVVGNGVEPVYFAAGKLPRVESERPYLLVVGGLTSRKGGDIVLQVAEILKGRNSELLIKVAGRSEPHLATASRSYDNIDHVGFLPDDELAFLLRNANALLFPSRYEGFGIPAAESMAAGTPAIVSGCAALPEVVGDAGFVIPDSDPEAFVEAAYALLYDSELRSRCEMMGRSRAMRYTWESCSVSLVSALRRH